MSEYLRDRGFSPETQLVAGEKLDQFKKIAEASMGDEDSWCVQVDIDGKKYSYYAIGLLGHAIADALFEGEPLNENP